MDGEISSGNVRPAIYTRTPERLAHTVGQVGPSNVLHSGHDHRGINSLEMPREGGNEKAL